MEEFIIRHLLAGSLKNKVCRICFSECDGLKPLLSRLEDDSSTIKDLLLCMTNMEMEDNQSMPENICQTCLDNLVTSYNFRTQCEDSNDLLNDVVRNFCDQLQNISCGDQTILIVLPEDKLETQLKQEEFVQNDTMDKHKEDDIFVNGLDLEHSKSEPVLFFDNERLEQNINEENYLSLVKDTDGSILETLLNKVKDESFFQVDSVKLEETNDFKESFECSMCLELFESKILLKKHRNGHPKDSRHICKYCFKSYRKSSILKRHLVTHSGSKMYHCKCGKSFYHKNALASHTRFHKDKKFLCSVCQETFYFRHALIQHLMHNHSLQYADLGDALIQIKAECIGAEELPHIKEIEYNCTMCTESFENAPDLSTHKQTHPEGTRHLCRVCGRTYLEVGTLNRHMFSHTGKKTHLCPVCGKVFYFKNVLQSHMVYHNEKKHACHACEKRYHTQHMVREHVRLAHSDDKFSFMCEECGKLCSSRSRLAIHRAGHGGARCQDCGKTYRSLRYFKEHLKRHRGILGKKKEFICDYCGESRTLKTLIELHILSKHLKERRYKCETCDKGFFNAGGLSEHRLVHSRQRSEKCQQCDAELPSRRALLLHHRLHAAT